METESDAVGAWAANQQRDDGCPNTEEDDFADLKDIKIQQDYASCWSELISDRTNNRGD